MFVPCQTIYYYDEWASTPMCYYFRMEHHDYIGDDERCRDCGRPPGNYIHAGLDDQEARGETRQSSVIDGVHAFPPSAVLLSGERAGSGELPR